MDYELLNWGFTSGVYGNIQGEEGKRVPYLNSTYKRKLHGNGMQSIRKNITKQRKL
jgi:hypothetical protein